MKPDCQLFGTLGCHLCEQAQSLLMPWVAQGLLVELLDIVDDPKWLERYALTIPVLKRLDTQTELNWPFDAQRLAQFLAS